MTRSRLRGPRLAPLALSALAVLGLGVAQAAATDGGSRLFVVSADSGTLAPRTGGGHVLVLKGVDRRATWFDDRPARAAGAIRPADIVRRWREWGFRDDPPNAAIRVAGNGSPTRVVTLRTPRYRARGRVLRIPVRAVSKLPRRRVALASPALYIDDALVQPGELDVSQQFRTPVGSTVTAVTTAGPGATARVEVGFYSYGGRLLWRAALSPSAPTATLGRTAVVAGTTLQAGATLVYVPGTALQPASVSARLSTEGPFAPPSLFDGVIAQWFPSGAPVPPGE